MRKIFFLLLCAATSVFAFTQGKTIYESSLLAPKPGMAKGFETALKNHTQKYHGTDKMYVFQIVSGPNYGMYQLVQGPYSWASLDSLKLGDGHDMDFDANIAAKTESTTGSSYVQFRPELSHGASNVTIEKSKVITLDIKPGGMDSVLMMLKKMKEAMDKANDKRIYSVYTKMLEGSSPQVILVFRYPNGWAEQETGYYPTMKNVFTTAYSDSDWNTWIRIIGANVEKNQTQLRIYRKDLSSQ